MLVSKPLIKAEILFIFKREFVNCIHLRISKAMPNFRKGREDSGYDEFYSKY